jgi:hypothetical protein
VKRAVVSGVLTAGKRDASGAGATVVAVSGATLAWRRRAGLAQSERGLAQSELDWRRAGTRERCDGYAEAQEIRAGGGEIPLAVGGIYASYHHLACTNVSANVGPG